MVTQVASLETLEQANVPASQARAIVEVVETRMEDAKSIFVTKQDLLVAQHALELRIDAVSAQVTELGAKLRGEMGQLAGAFRSEMGKLAGELRGETGQLAGELRGEMGQLAGGLRAEMGTLGAQLRGEMGTLDAELRAEMASMRADLTRDMGKLRSDLSRDMYLAILGQLAVLLGAIYFFTTHLAH